MMFIPQEGYLACLHVCLKLQDDEHPHTCPFVDLWGIFFEMDAQEWKSLYHWVYIVLIISWQIYQANCGLLHAPVMSLIV